MRSFLIYILVWLPLLGRAQPPLQVVNKIIEKTIPYQAGQMIQLDAQKADISLKGWNRPSVLVQLKLQAKHPQRSVAEHEVSYHQYTMGAKGGQITLSNRFVIPQRAGQLQSQLKAIYEISLPYEALVRLTNSFGDILVQTISGDMTITLEFGKLTLTDIKGKLSIVSDYGDIDGNRLHADLKIRAQKADIALNELGGLVEIRSQFGRLAFTPATSLTKLRIEAARTDIAIATKRLTDFQFEVTSVGATISIPETVFQYLTKTGTKQVFSFRQGDHKPIITIKNSYNPVTIQGEKPFVNK